MPHDTQAISIKRKLTTVSVLLVTMFCAYLLYEKIRSTGEHASERSLVIEASLEEQSQTPELQARPELAVVRRAITAATPSPEEEPSDRGAGHEARLLVIVTDELERAIRGASVRCSLSVEGLDSENSISVTCDEGGRAAIQVEGDPRQYWVVAGEASYASRWIPPRGTASATSSDGTEKESRYEELTIALRAPRVHRIKCIDLGGSPVPGITVVASSAFSAHSNGDAQDRLWRRLANVQGQTNEYGISELLLDPQLGYRLRVESDSYAASDVELLALASEEVEETVLRVRRWFLAGIVHPSLSKEWCELPVSWAPHPMRSFESAGLLPPIQVPVAAATRIKRYLNLALPRLPIEWILALEEEAGGDERAVGLRVSWPWSDCQGEPVRFDLRFKPVASFTEADLLHPGGVQQTDAPATLRLVFLGAPVGTFLDRSTWRVRALDCPNRVISARVVALRGSARDESCSMQHAFHLPHGNYVVESVRGGMTVHNIVPRTEVALSSGESKTIEVQLDLSRALLLACRVMDESGRELDHRTLLLLGGPTSKTKTTRGMFSMAHDRADAGQVILLDAIQQGWWVQATAPGFSTEEKLIGVGGIGPIMEVVEFNLRTKR